jgi:hypothetical protein
MAVAEHRLVLILMAVAGYRRVLAVTVVAGEVSVREQVVEVEEQ